MMYAWSLRRHGLDRLAGVATIICQQQELPGEQNGKAFRNYSGPAFDPGVV
jgi:hypothetical protein